MYGEEAGDDPTDEMLKEAGIPVIEVVNTAGEHSGTMEGALRSGKRAAAQVLERLGRG